MRSFVMESTNRRGEVVRTLILCEGCSGPDEIVEAGTEPTAESCPILRGGIEATKAGWKPIAALDDRWLCPDCAKKERDHD